MALPVEDVVAIQQLVARYCHAIDSGDAAGYASTFVEGGSFTITGRDPIRGREGLEGIARGFGQTSRHFVSNTLIEGEGDSATMKSYLDALPRGGGPVGATGVYTDRLRKVNGQWLFDERVFTADRRPEPRP